MTARRRVRRALRSLGALAVLGAFAYIVWPIMLGGSATFVVVRGHSMEGTYHQGDLLYARDDQAFAPGDVAVYRIPKGKPGAGALVVHRILRQLPDGTYLFQGDNKKAPDDVTPSRKDIVAVPMFDRGGSPTRGLILAPIIFTLVVGIAVTSALWPAKVVSLDTDDAEESSDDVDDEASDESASPRRRLLVQAGAGPVATLAGDETVDGQLVGSQGLAATDQLGDQRVGE